MILYCANDKDIDRNQYFDAGNNSWTFYLSKAYTISIVAQAAISVGLWAWRGGRNPRSMAVTLLCRLAMVAGVGMLVQLLRVNSLCHSDPPGYYPADYCFPYPGMPTASTRDSVPCWGEYRTRYASDTRGVAGEIYHSEQVCQAMAWKIAKFENAQNPMWTPVLMLLASLPWELLIQRKLHAV